MKIIKFLAIPVYYFWLIINFLLEWVVLVISKKKFSFRNQDKILTTKSVPPLSIASPTPNSHLTHIHLTKPQKVYQLILESGYKLQAADQHRVKSPQGWVYVQDLVPGDTVLTQKGWQKVKQVKKLLGMLPMLDVSVSPQQDYYSNGIVSHNTMTTAIALLHYICFEIDRNMVIIANLGDTSKEVLFKLKELYLELPYFIKPGTAKWTDSVVHFDNGCRIQALNTSQKAGVGKTLDFIYMDEAAYIDDDKMDSLWTTLIPTMKAVKDSKFIMTSTPNGYNKFYEIYSGALLGPYAAGGNSFSPVTIYWWQVPGALDTYLIIDPKVIKERDLTIQDIKDWVREHNLPIRREGQDDDNALSYRITLKYEEGVSDIETIRALKIKGEAIWEIVLVTNFREQEIINLGSAEKFSQEYDLKFVAAESRLFSSETMSLLSENSNDFDWVEMEHLENRLEVIGYKELKWNQDENILKIEYNDHYNYNITGQVRRLITNIPSLKEDFFIVSVDLSAGLGQDYSVLNIMRLEVLPMEIIEKKKDITNINDFFCLRQVGLYRNNMIGIDLVAEVFYILVFELMNPDNVRVVLEYNTFGEPFLKALKELWGGQNNYGSYIFCKYKHSIEHKYRKVGLRLTAKNKNVLVKSFQQSIQNKSIIVHDKNTILEISNFGEKTSTSGNIRYGADTGYDDIVMSLVNASSVFETIEYKTLIGEVLKNNSELALKLERILYERRSNMDMSNPNQIDYNSFYNSLNNKPPSNIRPNKGSSYMNKNPWFKK